MEQLSRERYKAIKKMNRLEMSRYLHNMYCTGYNAGVSTMASVTSQRVDDGVKSTKGIGPKLYEALMENIQKSINGTLTNQVTCTETQGEENE